MDLNKILEIGVAGIIAWVSILVVRFGRAQGKIVKLEQKEADHDITDKVHNMSDSELDKSLSSELSKRP